MFEKHESKMQIEFDLQLNKFRSEVKITETKHSQSKRTKTGDYKGKGADHVLMLSKNTWAGGSKELIRACVCARLTEI